MKKLSLFSGIGGIDLAAEWAGIETIAFCEREEFPQKVLQKNFPGIPIYDDVCELTKEKLENDGIDTRTIDLISAGYPCQPFSHAGKRRGKEDDRHLWPEVARLIREIRPTFFLGENVAGHITMGLDDVLADLENEGYDTQTFVIPSASVGAPHRRERVFIVGYAKYDGSYESEIGRSIDSTSNHFEKRENKASQLKGTSRSNHSKTLGDSTSKRLSQWRQSRFSQTTEKSGTGLGRQLERSSQILAHTTSKRSRQTWECESVRSEKWTTSSSKALVDSKIKRLQGSENARKNGVNRSQSRNQQLVGCDTDQTGRSIESGMGGVLDGIPGRLDEHRWPAALGEEQYDWEPPRIANGVKDRVGRLKGLGNAVNPHQIYPVLAALKAVNDSL